MEYGPVLIVEDSHDDFYAMQRTLKKVLPCAIVRCDTGNEALDYLFQRGVNANAASPALILLDLNLPGLNGRTVLERVKADPVLRAIPVVIVSTSNDPRDIADCYTLGCSGYVVKALSYTEFAPALQGICAYWFQTVTLP